MKEFWKHCCMSYFNSFCLLYFYLIQTCFYITNAQKRKKTVQNSLQPEFNSSKKQATKPNIFIWFAVVFQVARSKSIYTSLVSHNLHAAYFCRFYASCLHFPWLKGKLRCHKKFMRVLTLLQFFFSFNLIFFFCILFIFGVYLAITSFTICIP